jgi:hypothetical protein
MNPETRNCQNCKTDFSIEVNDFLFYEKIGVPAPTICPDCRYQRRISNRNEWELYRRNCSQCANPMVSIYNPEYPGPVFCLKCFWKDDWNPLEYGVDFDFSRPFFEQWNEMRAKVPKTTVAHFRCVNSEYTNQSQDLKNCYMCFAGDASEDCMYGSWYFSSRECIDCSMLHSCELLYEGLNCINCSRSSYIEDCTDCFESYFLKDCKGCNNCFGCFGLRSKSYCWLNEQLSKEEYQKRLSEFTFTRSNIKEIQAKHKTLIETLPAKYYKGMKITNSTGDYIQNAKNTRYGFNVGDAEDSAYAQDAWGIKDCVDITETAYNELDFEMEGVGYTARCVGISRSWNVFDSYYSQNCFSCNSVFGCASLHKKNYCILNKQYSKEEYLELKEKIIEHTKKTGEWGEFFPTEISLFAYNETVAQHYFPMTKEEVIAKGWRWHERGARNYEITKKYSEIPESIQEIDDTILKEIISCSSQDSEDSKKYYTSCTTAFRVTDMELMLHQRTGMPIPEKCFPCRFKDRLNKRTPRKLWHRKCMCNLPKHEHTGICPNEFETSYSPDRPEIIYCEKCYQQEVI